MNIRISEEDYGVISLRENGSIYYSVDSNSITLRKGAAEQMSTIVKAHQEKLSPDELIKILDLNNQFYKARLLKKGDKYFIRWGVDTQDYVDYGTIDPKLYDGNAICDYINSLGYRFPEDIDKAKNEKIKVKQEIIKKFNVPWRTPRDHQKIGEQRTIESYSDVLTYKQQYENEFYKRIAVEKELEYFNEFSYLLQEKKKFKCPNCGAPLKFIQLFNGKESNRGRLAICCTDKKRKNEKNKCAYLRPLDLLDYYVFHDWIIEFSSYGDYVRGEWEVTNPKHPNFIAPKILDDYKLLKCQDFSKGEI